MIEIRKGTKCDIESLIALMASVRARMENKEWLSLDAPDEVRKRMNNGTMSLWVAVDGERLAAAFDLLYPGLESFNYGYLLGLSQEELLKVVNMDTAVVHPAYRGLGLQKKLMHCAEKSFAATEEHILLCTVHPDNVFSLNNVLSQGHSVEKTVPLYGSVRHILRKDIGYSVRGSCPAGIRKSKS